MSAPPNSEPGASEPPIIDKASIQHAIATGRGQGVRIALLDTGVDDTHPDLAGAIAGSYEVIRDATGWQCLPRPASDAVGHGTACAGIIHALAPEAEIHSVKVIGNDARGSAEQLVHGLKWAIEAGCHIVNASLGTLDRKSREPIAELADQAFYAGVLIVAAANNRGQTAWPANLSSVLTVDSAHLEDPLRFHYRLATPIELEAKGIYVEAPTTGGGRKLFTGTSFACPHVTALAARLLSVHPGLQPFAVRAALHAASAD